MAIRKLIRTLAVCTCVAMGQGAAQATVFNQTETVYLVPSQISAMYDPVNDPIGGIPGNDWTVFLNSAPIPIAQAGDSLRFRILFSGDDLLRVTDTGNGFLGGAENLWLSFRLNDGVNDSIKFRYDYEIHFLDAVGDLAPNPFVGDLQGGGHGLPLYIPASASLTASSGAFSGFEFRLSFSEFETTGSPLIPNAISVRAGLLEIESVPEPTSVSVFGIGLAGLGAMRRKKPAA